MRNPVESSDKPPLNVRSTDKPEALITKPEDSGRQILKPESIYKPDIEANFKLNLRFSQILNPLIWLPNSGRIL